MHYPVKNHTNAEGKFFIVCIRKLTAIFDDVRTTISSSLLSLNEKKN